MSNDTNTGCTSLSDLIDDVSTLTARLGRERDEALALLRKARDIGATKLMAPVEQARIDALLGDGK